MDFFIFQVIPKEVLHLRVSLIIFNLIINQQNPNNCKKIFIRTIFNWKMSKLFGQAGRAHNKRTCPNLILSILLGRQGNPIWTYVQNFIVFSFHLLLTEILKKLKGIDNERNDTELHFNILYSAICDKFLDYD